MRRVLAVAAALSLALVPALGSSASAKRIRSLGIGGSGSTVGGGGFFILGGLTIEETVGGPTVTYNSFTVSVYDGIGGYANGFGPLTLDIDPTLTTGTLTGTVGGITVDLTFLSTAVGPDVPSTSVEIVPTAPQEGTAATTFSRRSRVNGSLVSANTGLVPAVNGVVILTQTIAAIVTS